jgi:spermidine synthase
LRFIPLHESMRAIAKMVPLLLILFLASGFTGLVYEVLWMRQLGLILGHTAHAAALTLAVFFAGLSAGSFLWGGRAARSPNPLRIYALLEVGIAAAAVLALALFKAYAGLYPALFQRFHETPPVFLAFRCALAAAALFPPALLMGGTLPAMGQHLIRRADQLGRTGSLLYAVNTAGGAGGAFVAGFYLPITLGFTNAYLLAVVLTLAIGIVAYALSRARDGASAEPSTPEKAGRELRDGNGGGASALEPRALLLLAGLSGFAALGLEVLWTLMFAQVLHNSVYSFALILATFLLALGLGSGLAHMLARTAAPPPAVLFCLLLSAAIATGATPLVFRWITGGLAYVAAQADWRSYVGSVFITAAATILIPGLLLGAVFPYLLRLAQGSGVRAGEILGRLAAANMLGAIAGSLLAGFALLPWLGLWPAIRTLALLYALAALLVAEANERLRPWCRAAAVGAVVLLVTALDPSRLPVVRADPKGRDCVYEVWQSRYGVVSVVRTGDNLRTKVDNHYSLGGTAARSYEETQADVPLMIHPRPRTAFFLGLGTGITAGAALRHPVEKVTSVELIPEVVEAARKYFTRYTGGLFTDPRSRVVVADGRNYLLGTDDTYDVIVSDLFIPWQAGAGSLYTREQFETVKRRLAPGGVFAQWLPLYQLSRRETFIIIHTLLEVFPQVTLWRGDFLPDRPIVALVAEAVPRPLDAGALVENFRRRRQSDEVPRERVLGLLGLFYAGNAGANREMFASYPVNTDDRPVVEYSSPVTQRQERARAETWFTGLDLASWQRELQERVPPEADPYLSRLEEREPDFVRAGLRLFEARVHGKAGREAEAKAAADEFYALVPYEISRTFREQIEQWSKKESAGGGRR